MNLMKKQNWRQTVLFCGVLLLAFFVRVYGINWDSGFHMHPDERMIVMVVEKLQLPESWSQFLDPNSSWNPKFFAYGSLPLYLLKLTSIAVSFFLGKEWLFYQNLPILGRLLSVMFDLGTLILIFKIGRRLFSKKHGFWAAFFYATCVFPVQLSHFYAVDIMLNFFIWLTLWALICFYKRTNWLNAVFIGFSFAAALATKASAGVLSGVIGLTLVIDFILIGFRLFRQSSGGLIKRLIFLINRSFKKQIVFRIFLRLLVFGSIIGLVTIVSFFVFQPYAFLDWPNFINQIEQQSEMTKDAYVFPYTLQYVGTLAYLYPLKNILLWGIGLGFGLVSLIGLSFYIFDLIKRVLKPGDCNQEAIELIVAVFALVYFLITGRFAVKFMRYLLPVYPFLVLAGVWFLFKSIKAKKVILITVSVAHLFYLLAFLSIYSRPNTRVQATDWINEHIPAGSTIAIEHWDDRLPLIFDKQFSFLEMPMYEPDTLAAKWVKVENNLVLADYLILASNRLYVPLQKLADCEKYKKCYPKTAQFYTDLFSGEVGFSQVAEFESYPGFKFLNLWFSDQSADESFTVYDHPKVIIFGRD